MTDSAAVSIEVGVSADEAQAAIADVTQMGRWSPECYRCTWRQPGRRFRGWNRAGAVRWATTGTVVADVPGREFTFDVSSLGIPVARWSWGFEPLADGSCRVTETWTDRRPGGLTGRALRGLSSLGTRTPHDATDTPRNLQRTLERVKSELEGQSAHP